VIAECEMESKPQQIEFARLNITNTVMSKRKLKLLVDEGVVDGWDDPRMPTIAGLRRRGYTPEAIRSFCREIGVSKSNSIVDGQLLEHFIRDDLISKTPRVTAVLKPIKVVITNYPEGQVETLESPFNIDVPEMGTREIPFSRDIFIDAEDFMENPPKKYHRLYPGNEVRLKDAYFIKCNEVIKDKEGNITELHCTYDIETKSGSGFTERKVKGTIHWVEANNALPAEFRLFEPLFLDDKDDDDGKKFLDQINPNSLEILQGFVEPSIKGAVPQSKYQFIRVGYFSVDTRYTTDTKLVFNRIVSLKSSFKI
ncbi:MAG: glutamine--tRNA ligase, partial [Firmicutes bacterium]|nr:glutamine--tRNA ligase [Bacillota bacterium]